MTETLTGTSGESPSEKFEITPHMKLVYSQAQEAIANGDTDALTERLRESASGMVDDIMLDIDEVR